ncbi:MAG: 3-phosphoshikimate 1-carboxyvinyltransferase [Holophagales bacterium]|nr:3-phosphoshikimate 1-carboxyvinyltransferase [Holophagales bacterium]
MDSRSTSRSTLDPEPYRIPAGRVARGEVHVPGSKSITQRYFCLALLHRRALEVVRPLVSEDTLHFLGALEAAGSRVERGADRVGIGAGSLEAAEGEGYTSIDCGAGGTMFRFLTAALAAVPGRWRLDGIPRLRERPVGPLLSALRRLGARVECPDEDGFAPLHIEGGSLEGGNTVLDAGASSQFLSALLLAGTAARRGVSVELEALTSEPYVNLTVDAIHDVGGAVERTETGGRDCFRVKPLPSAGWPRQVRVEGDYSSAAYPAAAAALTRGEVFLPGLRADSRQGDRAFLDLLATMGAELEWQDTGGSGNGGQSNTGPGLRVRGRGPLLAVAADLSAIPDQVPTLAALAPFAEGTTRIENVPHLRIKESDRLAAMASELRKAGAEVEELEDGLIIPGVWAEGSGKTPPDSEADIATWGDHRIAMAMSLVALRRPGLRIHQPEVVAKSYPDYWRDLESLLGS